MESQYLIWVSFVDIFIAHGKVLRMSISSRTVRQRFSQNLRLIVLILILGGLLTAFTLYPFSSSGTARTSSSTGDFRTIPLDDIDGNEIHVSDFEGKVVVLEFMATWCLVCAQQESILKEVDSKYQSDDVVLLAVTVDPSFDTPEVLRNHIAKKGITWMITRDTTLMFPGYFQVTELPTILIISPDGQVNNRFNGFTDTDTLSRAVDALL